jgi:hypothetical protein
LTGFGVDCPEHFGGANRTQSPALAFSKRAKKDAGRFLMAPIFETGNHLQMSSKVLQALKTGFPRLS